LTTTTVVEAIIELRRAAARAAAATFTGDISGRQAAVLREIRASGPVSQVSLARATASDPSFVVRLLDDLESRGLVSRRRSMTDRREMAVALTPRGRRALGPVDVAHARLARATEGDLTAEERAAFVALAAKIGRSLAAVAASAVTASEAGHGHR